MSVPAVFRRGAGVAALIQVAAMGLGFGAQMFYTNTMTRVDYGILAQVVALTFVISHIVVLGVPKAHQQLLPHYLTNGRMDLAAGWRRCARWVTATGALAACIIGLPVAAALDTHPAWTIGVLCIPWMGASLSQQGLALADKRVFLARFPIEVARPASAVLLFAAGGLWGRRTATDASVAWAVACVAIVVVSVIPLRMPTAMARTLPSYEWTRWRTALTSYTGQSTFDLLLQKSDLLLVGWMIGPEAAAVYAIAIGLGKLLNFGLQAVNAILAPLVAELHTREQPEEVQRVLRMGVTASASVGIATGLLLFVGAPWILGVFGEGYVSGVWVLRVGLLGYLFNSLAGSCGLLASMSGHPQVTTRAIGLAWVVLALGSVVTIPMLGMEGAAATRALSMALWNLALVRWARRNLSLDPSIACLTR